ncbi:hypothetical protein [uncultured Paludibaculum sp.]|uniref:hypothetical protein n=1 Tax=uncultured Paludibaculum sp. TaxID=1765020 RepID=UPI002AAB5907|nr:hypothetical protein [uncultured Paludibaculum sp.]
MSDRDFYVGYIPRASAGVASFVRRATAAIALTALAAALLLNYGESPFPASTFEYQQYRSYEGLLVDWPYPMLVTATQRYLLVATGKHGFATPGLDGRRVQLEGALIHRDQDRMLEVLPASIRTLARDEDRRSQFVDLGDVILTGEIVDSKCYLGAMNPGQGKVHRDCAVRCISGGVPPAFRVRDEGGVSRILLLTGRDGRRLGSEVLDFVGEPITIAGRLRKQGPTFLLQAEPREFRRE